MDQRLREVAQEGNIDELYALIREDPYLLERIDEIPFVDTPLHVAAFEGHTRFAMEIMRLKPSFARKPNPDGFCPTHLALQNGHTQMVLRLVHVDPDLVRVKGREGITHLHYVAKTGNIDILTEFLSVCPTSVEDLTIRSETALHVAVKNNMFEAFKVLLGWLQRSFYEHDDLALKYKVLNSKDEEGNTVLHIAASTNQPNVVRLLVDNGVDVNAKNLEGFTALGILTRQTQLGNGEMVDLLRCAGALRASGLPSVSTLAEYLRLKMPFYEIWVISIIRGKIYLSSHNRNALLVVAVLIATTTYQAGLSPPGGVWQDANMPRKSAINAYRSHVGITVLMPFEFKSFTFLNTAALYMSIAIIYILLPSEPYGLTLMLMLPLGLLVMCYMWSIFLISPDRFPIYLFLILFSSTFVLCLLVTVTYRKIRLLRKRTKLSVIEDF